MIVWVSVVLNSELYHPLWLLTWSWLFKRWIALYIHRIHFYPAHSTTVSRNAYPVETAVQRFNKRDLIGHLRRRDVIGYEVS